MPIQKKGASVAIDAGRGLIKGFEYALPDLSVDPMFTGERNKRLRYLKNLKNRTQINSALIHDGFNETNEMLQERFDFLSNRSFENGKNIKGLRDLIHDEWNKLNERNK